MSQGSVAGSGPLSNIRATGRPPANEVPDEDAILTPVQDLVEAAQDESTTLAIDLVPYLEEATQHGLPFQPDDLMEPFNYSARTQRFLADYKNREKRMHRLPVTLRCIDSQYIKPKVVAIGPYHHGSEPLTHLYLHLQEMEKVKHVAASCFVRLSRRSYKQIYSAMLNVARDARLLYDSMEFTDDEFATMMFYDACFLATYMIWYIHPSKLDPPLERVYFSNRDSIDKDIMLLENQLPLLVLRKLVTFRTIKEFIAKTGQSCQIRLDSDIAPRVFDARHGDDYGHLLAILRLHKTGETDSTNTPAVAQNITTTQATVSAIELAEMGIKLAASTTEVFVDMTIRNKGPLFGKLILAPLLLDKVSASWLVNMAAFEVCTATSPGRDDNKTIVCAYLSVLGMLMDREEDAHQLRTKHLLQGRFTNKEAFHFFKVLTQNLPIGPSFYDGVMLQIESYRKKRWIRIKVHKFFYNNMKIILKVLTVIGFLVALVNVIVSNYKRNK